MKLPAQSGSKTTPEVKLAILLDGITEKWQMNVLQILGRPGSAKVEVDGHGTIEAPAILLSQTQARHLATQIIELLGPEN
jgi:hypothetical protein